MRLILLFHTLRHLRLSQLLYQVWYRIYRPRYVPTEEHCLVCLPNIKPFPRKEKSYTNGIFSFISLSGRFTHWQDISRGMLWTYNLNYMDWLLQEGLSYEEGRDWIDHFIESLPENKIGQAPYPTALRIINWTKFICLYRENVSEDTRRAWDSSLCSQVDLLLRRLEYHLLGNHLLEDICALFIASIYLSDGLLSKRAIKMLKRELQEQILPDGAHYEQAPMYHCILLDRLLDCYNFAMTNSDRLRDQSILEVLRSSLISMLGHLESIVYRDGSIPLVNDSAYGIALPYRAICSYAKSLCLEWKSLPMKEAGYRWLRTDSLEVFIDVANVMATYQPGHTHADSLSYELRIGGVPIVVDTGISTYDKTSRREYERATSAHNTVIIEGRNSSETWGGFRVGKRAHTTLLLDTDTLIHAEHDGFGRAHLHYREFALQDKGLRIRDCISHNEATTLLHLAPDLNVLSSTPTQVILSGGIVIDITGAYEVTVTENYISRYYNKHERIQVLHIQFSQEVEYFIHEE